MMESVRTRMNRPEHAILVDMDGVLADFEAAFRWQWSKIYPDRPQLPESERTQFRILDCFDPCYSRDVLAIYHARGFFERLNPIPGAVTALREMDAMGYSVYICTSPMISTPYCLQEKHAWVEQHLGSEWVARLIFTKNKAMIRGRFLIDDNPGFADSPGAEWEWIAYDSPYNRHITARRRLNWDNWREILPPA